MRETSNPLGRKLLQVLEEQGTPDDLVALAAAFDVSVPSTYDWIRHGRFAKERFGRLVEWSGHDLNWWFDIELATATGLRLVHGTGAAIEWPFQRVPYAAVKALSPAELSSLDDLLANGMSMLRPGESRRIRRGPTP